MKEYKEPIKSQLVQEPEMPFMRTFSSKEEADLFNLMQDIKRSDMEKFNLFCRMIKIGSMLAAAKTAK